MRSAMPAAANSTALLCNRLLTASQIGEACRWELLSWEQSFNAQQAAWGSEQYWIWQPLFGTCGLAGGSGSTGGGSTGGGGGAPVVTEPPAGGGSNAAAPTNETFWNKASQTAEQVGSKPYERGQTLWVCFSSGWTACLLMTALPPSLPPFLSWATPGCAGTTQLASRPM